jgi:hypothetical protein
LTLPFTAAQFFDLFADYNDAIWPTQVVAYLAGFAALTFLVRPGVAADRIAAAALAAMWLWTGIAYHGAFFADVNPAAYAFAALFVAQGALFVHDGVTHRRLRFACGRDAVSVVGPFFLIYAAILYPLIGAAVGHGYPRAPAFGVTPCPVTIFTFGMLLLASRRPPVRLWIIPALWSLIGGSAAFLLHVPQDWLLLASGAVAIALGARRPTAAT